jgi:hypothetical protein
VRGGLLAVLAGASLLASAFAAAASPPADVPPELVIDVRLFEARSSSPSFALFQNLSFFVDTDGTGVSETQWLGTVAGQVPESFVTVLASETLAVNDGRASFRHALRSRGVELDLDLSQFLPRGTFPARLTGAFTRGETDLRTLERELELRVGQTYLFSGRNLELAPSDYLSHFREYEDSDHRARLYEYLRSYVVFLLVAVTPRMARAPGGPPEPVEVSLPTDVELPELESPAGVELTGTLVLEFDVDDAGAPVSPVVRRSTIPEVTLRVLLELPQWRFPEATGKRALLTLKLHAKP